MECWAGLDSFVMRCEHKHLEISVTKIKEMIVDFRRTRKPVTPVSMQGADVKIVKDYKYLRAHSEKKMKLIHDFNKGALRSHICLMSLMLCD